MNSRQAFIFNHFNTLFTSYDGSIPFQHFFKKYCKVNPALGSKDRRILREIIYGIYRFGPIWKDQDPEDLFLWPFSSEHKSSELLSQFYGDSFEPIVLPEPVYPFTNELDSVIDTADFLQSILTQPLVWVRVKTQNVSKFKKSYQEQIEEEITINETFVAFGLVNGTSIEPDPLLFEIQDLTSQIVSSKIRINDGEKVWDCCSGSGGKSLFISETNKKTRLYVSDVRPAILENLKIRFKHKRLDIPKIAIVDLIKKPEKINFSGEFIGRNHFDVIIADVPCSGSGTWAREPEYLSFFNSKNLEIFTKRQLEIVRNSLRFLKPGGKLYYITCSVFESENMAIINDLEAEGLLKVVSSEKIYNYSKKADNMFIALLEKK